MKYLFFIFPFVFFAQGSVVFDTGFETTADLDGTSDAWRSDLGNPDATIVTDGTAREGSGYLKITDDNSTSRSEISRQYIGAEDTYFLDWNTEYWLRYSIRVISPVQGYHIATQFRPYGDNGTNAYTLDTEENGLLRFRLHTNSEIKDDTPSTSASWGSTLYDSTYELGEWTDIVMHFNIDPDDGFWQIWVNDLQILDHVGTTTFTKKIDGSTKDPRNYMKIGAYYGTTNGNIEVDFDAFKLWEGAGFTYDDVSLTGDAGDLPQISDPRPEVVKLIKRRASVQNIIISN